MYKVYLEDKGRAGGSGRRQFHVWWNDEYKICSSWCPDFMRKWCKNHTDFLEGKSLGSYVTFGGKFHELEPTHPYVDEFEDVEEMILALHMYAVMENVNFTVDERLL